MILVNAEDMILGRLASFTAKKAIEGETVTIVNVEKAVISGSKEYALKKMRVKLDLKGKGNPEIGPKFSRMPDKILRMAIRGMLPWKSSRGKEAYRRVHAYIGMPEEFAEKEFETIPGHKENDFKKTIQLGEMCKLLGARW